MTGYIYVSSSFSVDPLPLISKPSVDKATSFPNRVKLDNAPAVNPIQVRICEGDIYSERAPKRQKPDFDDDWLKESPFVREALLSTIY